MRYRITTTSNFKNTNELEKIDTNELSCNLKLFRDDDDIVFEAV